MRPLLFCLVLLGTFAYSQTSASGSSATQSTTSTAATSATSSSQAQAGTVVPAVLNKSVDSKKAKVGDEVSARTVGDIRSANGVVIPKDSKLFGKVTQASARNKGDASSALGITFDRAVPKGGKTIALTSTIQALIAPPAPAPMNSDSGGPMGETPASGGGGYGSSGSAAGGPSVPNVGVGDVARTAGSTVGSATNSVGSTASAATTPIAGSDINITSSTTGVVGMKNLELNSSASADASGSVITSNDKSVKLESGTRLLINVTAANPEEPAKK